MSKAKANPRDFGGRPDQRGYVVTYDIVTPESVEEGDTSEAGWVIDGQEWPGDLDEASVHLAPTWYDPDVDDEDGPIAWMVKLLRDAGADPSSSAFHAGVWYIGNPNEDYSTGAVTTYAYHLEGFAPDDQRAVFVGVTARKHNPLHLTRRDHSVIAAFVDKKPDEGTNLSTDGVRLDGTWMGGTSIASWEAGKIAFHDLGSKAAQTVQSAIRKAAPTNWVRDNPLRNPVVNIADPSQWGWNEAGYPSIPTIEFDGADAYLAYLVPARSAAYHNDYMADHRARRSLARYQDAAVWDDYGPFAVRVFDKSGRGEWRNVMAEGRTVPSTHYESETYPFATFREAAEATARAIVLRNPLRVADPSPTLQSGYAFQSSRRYPREPETVVVDAEQDGAAFVGYAPIDGTKHAAFKVPNANRYYFQVAR
jgi:hypothetical protein